MMTHSIQHVNVMVDDLASATEFYGGLLGLAPDPTPDLGFPAQFFAVGGGQQIHVNELEDVHAERAHFCVRLDDFSTVFRRAYDAGVVEINTWGKVRRLPTGVMQAFVRDPSGNLIELSCEADHVVDPSIFELDVVDGETRFFNAADTSAT
jgi:lactoylglutathione lyase